MIGIKDVIFIENSSKYLTLLAKQRYLWKQYSIPNMDILADGLHEEHSHEPSIFSLRDNRKSELEKT